MRALLFDIDGTLMTSLGMGGAAFTRAIREVCGCVVNPADYDWLGRVDTEVLREMLSDHRFTPSEIEQATSAIFASYLVYLQELTDSKPDKFQSFPGVEPLLRELTTQGYFLALITGNIREAAYIKLKAAGISDYFPFGVGGFGDDHPLRSELVRVSLRSLEEYYGAGCSRNPLVFGDSHRDIEAAQANQIPCIAVATGKMSVEQLRTYCPQEVFADFSDLDAVLKAISL